MKKLKSRKKARKQPVTTSVKPAAKVALRGTVPSKLRKAELRHVPWSTVPVEALNPLLGRQLIVGQNIMLARVLLKKGCIVPEHSHRNEQVTFILGGALKFWIDGKEIVVFAVKKKLTAEYAEIAQESEEQKPGKPSACSATAAVRTYDV